MKETTLTKITDMPIPTTQVDIESIIDHTYLRADCLTADEKDLSK